VTKHRTFCHSPSGDARLGPGNLAGRVSRWPRPGAWPLALPPRAAIPSRGRGRRAGGAPHGAFIWERSV